MAHKLSDLILPPPSASTPSLTNDSLDYPLTKGTTSSEYVTKSSRGFSRTIRSISAFTNLPSEEIEAIQLTDKEQATFNLIYFIDSDLLTPFGPLDWNKDPETNHYCWKARSTSPDFPTVEAGHFRVWIQWN